MPRSATIWPTSLASMTPLLSRSHRFAPGRSWTLVSSASQAAPSRSPSPSVWSALGVTEQLSRTEKASFSTPSVSSTPSPSWSPVIAVPSTSARTTTPSSFREGRLDHLVGLLGRHREDLGTPSIQAEDRDREVASTGRCPSGRRCRGARPAGTRHRRHHCHPGPPRRPRSPRRRAARPPAGRARRRGRSRGRRRAVPCAGSG